MKSHRSDVLIVGGGPAGSTCAWRLRRAGLDVTVIDKASFPRDKTCAGWITPAVVDALELDVDDYRRGRHWQPIRGFRCGVVGGGDVTLDYVRPVSFGIRRCEFDDYLLRRAEADGRYEQPVRSVERVDGEWQVNGRYSAPMLVGAGGHFCPVAKSLGTRERQTRSAVVAQEVEFPIPADQSDRVAVRADVPELYFCADMRGYGWCFRKENYLNVGLGRVGDRRIRSHVDDFCRFLERRHRVNCDLPPRFSGHAYHLYAASDSPPVADGVLLVGDSAGLAYRQSGEGIRPAVESGIMAAEQILEAGGDYRIDRLRAYGDRLRRRFGAPHAVTSALGAILPTAWLAPFAAKLVPHRWFARHVVIDRMFLR